MTLYFLSTILSQFSRRRPLLLYTATWTLVLTVTVAVASFSPEVAFVMAISPSSLFSKACKGDGFVRVPLDLPGEVFCLRSQLFRKSRLDLLVPSLFAALIVGGSACVVRALGLWEDEDG